MPDSTLPSDAHAERHDRTAKIEELLLAGLDYYFAGEHERAISVWTRVLFLDRGHARARAYIERARTALAERQRESEELVQRGAAAFDAGRAADARQLLQAAVASGGPHDVAIALLDRLDRLEALPQVDPSRGAQADPRRNRLNRRGLMTSALWFMGLALVALGALALYVAGRPGPPTSRSATPRTVRPVAVEPLPLPRSAELSLARARARAAAGHLKEALRELERIAPGDPAHPEAQRLRAEIQASLVAGLPLRATERRSAK